MSFAVSALLLRRLRPPRAARPAGQRGIFREGGHAFGALGRDRLLRAMAVAQALAALSAGATSALLVVLAQEHLRTSDTGYGAMLAAIAVGSVAGPLLLARLGRRARHPATLFSAFGIRGLVDLVLAATSGLPVALPALAAYGVGTSIGSVTFSSILQSHVPDHRRGRTFAAFDVIWQAMRLSSLLAGGVLADAYGITAVYWIGGVLLLLAAAAGAFVVHG